MFITEVRPRRGRQVLLVLDGEPAVTVDSRTFDESPYRAGGVIDDDQLRELLDRSEKNRAREKALYLLSMRDHSRGELERKLRRTAGEQTAAETAARMEEIGLVNDEAYAAPAGGRTGRAAVLSAPADSAGVAGKGREPCAGRSGC